MRSWLKNETRLPWRFLPKMAKEPGLPPGTLVHTGEQKTEEVVITLIDYDNEHCDTRQLDDDPSPLAQLRQSPSVSWINVDGVHRVDLIQQIGEQFGLHGLILEDIVHTSQRPKTENYDSHLFVVIQMLTYNEEEQRVRAEQVSMVLGQHYVLTFQENPGDVFTPIRERIKTAKGRFRYSGPDYLHYDLVDAVVDHYFVVLEKLGERIEALQDDIVNKTDDKTLQRIYTLKPEMILLRRACWPVRELLADLQRSESTLIAETTAPFLRDVYDHSIRVIETMESYRDMANGMLDVYLTMVSNKMNEVMKVLTIIATIFIPLTFIAGVYGMNFQHMPELAWPWAYPVVWIIMVAVAIVMLIMFRRKRWL